MLTVKIFPKIVKTILGIVAGPVWLDTRHKAARCRGVYSSEAQLYTIYKLIVSNLTQLVLG